MEVYHTKEWGVVARFRINASSTRDVVFKACFLKVYASGPLFYELLNRCCSGIVPTLISWTKVNDQTWTLFEPFEGQSAARTPTLQTFISVAQTLAYIQTKVADLPQRDLHHLPHVEVADIPDLLDGIIRYVHEKHARYWSEEEGPFAELMPKLPKVLRDLAKFGESLEKWATELSAGGWPDTIDHTDLHPNNAVIRPDGRLLIFDWEESKISLPFFSLDELLGRVRLVDRQRLDIKQQAQSSCTIGPWEQAVREAYLDALPGGSRGRGRERWISPCAYHRLERWMNT
jgi:thiamine kinase-like enzyme